MDFRCRGVTTAYVALTQQIICAGTIDDPVPNRCETALFCSDYLVPYSDDTDTLVESQGLQLSQEFSFEHLPVLANFTVEHNLLGLESFRIDGKVWQLTVRTRSPLWVLLCPASSNLVY